jgi:hypothetical protein
MKTNNHNSTTTNIVYLAIALLAFACFALSPRARAVCQDACLTNFNTVQGDDALLSVTTGTANTAIGFNALYSDTTGGQNTAVGYQALYSHTSNGPETSNTAVGYQALYSSTTGYGNLATGRWALFSNTDGFQNTASGNRSLYSNTTGAYNTANGLQALYSNTTGNQNTAVGNIALYSCTGSSNIAVGDGAGSDLTNGNFNIDIGNDGVAGESKTIRIGTRQSHRSTFIAGISGVTVSNGVGVIVNPQGQLGTVVSSERFKDGIKPMDKASEAILALQPVTFHYKKELDPEGIPQFGLVAEQVEKVNPDLVARDDQGKPYTVRYEAVNAMLLNEFLKEHKRNEKQEATIAQLQSYITQQEKEIAGLTTALKAQAAQIQKVNDQLEAQPAAQRLVAND